MKSIRKAGEEQVSKIKQLILEQPRKGEERPLCAHKIAKMFHITPARANYLLGKARRELRESESFGM